jgi:signal transduction histidine kinase
MLRWIVAAREDDAWYEEEPPWGRSLVVEMRRLNRRAAARPVITLLFAIAMTGLVVLKVAKKPPVNIAHVVIAVSEGNLASGRDPIPVSQMQEFVNSALMPDDKLGKLITEMDLFPLRKKLGMPFALGELRDMTDVTVYRNYFVSDTYDPYLRRTARIEIAVSHADGHVAFEVAHKVAGIIVSTSDEIQDRAAQTLLHSADLVVERAQADARALDKEISDNELALRDAERKGDTGKAAGLRAQLAQLDVLRRDSDRKLEILSSGILMDRAEAGAMAAGLDLRLEIVSERQPLPDVGREARLGIITIIVFILMLPVAAVAIGAFDARIHDTGDVTRLGFTSLGHVPGFAGDGIGSLRARGIRRRRAAQY